jgi:hypothetical protein
VRAQAIQLRACSVPDHQALGSHLARRQSPQRISAWFDDHEIADKPRHNGAFSYSFTVKDAVAAARAAGAKVQRLEARRSYARGRESDWDPSGLCGSPATPGRCPCCDLNAVSTCCRWSAKTMYSVNQSDRLDEALE